MEHGQQDNMAKDLTRLWGSFTLLEEESYRVVVPITTLGRIRAKGHACLVGKLIANRIVGKDFIRSSIFHWWKPTGSLSLKVLGENLFLIEFEHS
jgi:hypothetical protein